MTHLLLGELSLQGSHFFTILEQMPKRDFLGGFELIVLLALLRLREDAYGVPIVREIEERTRREVAVGSVYATLERLEEKGLVSSVLGDSTPERGGRAKKYFHITALGLRQVRSTRRALESLWHRLPQLEGA